MKKETIRIQGMSCQHCVMAVKKAVGNLGGVTETDVEIGSATVTFDEAKVKKAEIETAIKKAGFEITN